LRRERLREIHLRRNSADLGDAFASQRLDLRSLVFGEGVGEVEEEHGE
jgi:hypothetical protein